VTAPRPCLCGFADHSDRKELGLHIARRHGLNATKAIFLAERILEGNVTAEDYELVGVRPPGDLAAHRELAAVDLVELDELRELQSPNGHAGPESVRRGARAASRRRAGVVELGPHIGAAAINRALEAILALDLEDARTCAHDLLAHLIQIRNQLERRIVRVRELVEVLTNPREG
jgi:hypothetical protein